MWLLCASFGFFLSRWKTYCGVLDESGAMPRGGIAGGRLHDGSGERPAVCSSLAGNALALPGSVPWLGKSFPEGCSPASWLFVPRVRFIARCPSVCLSVCLPRGQVNWQSCSFRESVVLSRVRDCACFRDFFVTLQVIRVEKGRGGRGRLVSY